MPNGPYTGPLKVRVLAPGESGEPRHGKAGGIMSARRSTATMCVNGHVYTPETTGYRLNSRADKIRLCRICDRARKARLREKRRLGVSGGR